MEKRTLLAVVISVVVLFAFYMVQGYFFPPAQQQAAETAPEPGARVSEEVSAPAPSADGTSADALPGQVSGGAAEETAVVDAGPGPEAPVVIDTPLMIVTLSNAGGDIVSYKLKEHNDREDLVDMVLSGSQEAHAFAIAFGGINAKPVTSYFYINRLSRYAVEFYRDFSVSQDGSNSLFRLTKRYEFKPDEYMFELNVSLNGVEGGLSAPSLNFSGAAYTLSFGPQIGPTFEKLDQRYEYRNYYSFTNGKRKQEKVSGNGPTVISSRVSWAAIAGKYFTFIAVPDATQYEVAFASTPEEPGLSAASRFYMVRPAVNGARTTDTYRFYLGPKSQPALAPYDTGVNQFNLRDMQFTRVADTSGFLGPLESLLKWFLTIFYKIIPNYGVAIILVTLLVKVLMFPLTKKGSEATLRMQTLAPKIKELQEKYKDNPQKLNMEMAEFYKKEGYNPMSGCLPMLIQIPIFFAMYNLFNNHFDLRGALFIPGWIPDLSLPESVWDFSPFRLPILGWSNLRLLPFIYVGSQLLYGKVTQTPDQQGNAQMKMMLYAMPIIFFFILYDVPSGLLIYWIMSNILTMVQQVTINKFLAKKRAAMALSNPEPVIAPRKRKKK